VSQQRLKSRIVSIEKRTRGGNSIYFYKKFKEKAFREKNFLCELCGDVAIYLHHIKSPKTFPELELDMSNIMILCEKCHCAQHPELNIGFMTKNKLSRLAREKWLKRALERERL
jgi:5-methylcytosine-specific restriction endonuclease McrA